MQTENLRDFLTQLPSREFESPSDFERNVITEFIDILGYEDDNLFFGHVYSTDGRIDLAVDAIVGRNRITRPWILIEAKYYDSKIPGREEDNILYRIEAEGNPQFSVLISNAILSIRVGRSETHRFDLRDIGDSEAERIFKWLKPPDSFPTEEFYEDEMNLPDDISYPNFSIEVNEYQKLLRQTISAVDPNIKGDLLEELAEYLFEGLKHVEVREVNQYTASSEIDLVIEFKGSSELTIFDDYGRYFLVECRNWEKAIGAKHIRDFVGKIQNTHTKLGLIFSKSGVSGTSRANDALREIDLAFQNKGISVIVIDHSDLTAISNGANFYDIIETKLYELRFSL